jgi:hypothetical protein
MSEIGQDINELELTAITGDPDDFCDQVVHLPP